MKTIIKYLLGLLVLISVSCTEKLDIIDKNEFGSELESDGSLFKSSFLIDSSIVHFSQNITKIKAHLTSLSDNDLLSDILTHIEHNKDGHRLTMHFTKKITDGDYLLQFTRFENGKTKGAPNIGDDLEEFTFHLTIENMMVKSLSLKTVSQASFYNGLMGSGTSDKPYLIFTSDQFGQFKYALSKDPERGRGLFFKQKSSFDSPKKSNTSEGSYTSSYEFAGNYDGDGNTIYKVKFFGYEDDDKRQSNVGLFSILNDGARISNLNIEFSYDMVGDNCGGLAGQSNGTVAIENVTVNGYILDAQNNIGGLIGEVSSSSDLTIKDCCFGVTLKGASNIGGLLGTVDNDSKIIIDGASNIDDGTNTDVLMLTIKGSGEKVGGVVGSIESSYYEIKNVKLQNSVSEEEHNIHHIWAMNGNVGGVVGLIENNINSSCLDSIEVKTTVFSEADNVGGIVGSYHGSNLESNNSIIQNVTFASYIEGNDHVGGFIGYIDNNYSLIFNGGNSINQISNGDLGIKGCNDVGGVIGYARSDISFKDSFSINISVNGNNNVGGCIGSYGNGTLSCSNFIPSSSMIVNGLSDVGGIVGELFEWGHIKGTTPSISDKINELGSIPAASQFSNFSSFAGTVNATEGSGGGIVGAIKHDHCSLKDLTFTGTVKGITQTGGIVGYISNRVNYYATIDNCINLSHKLVGNSTNQVGGIAGEITQRGAINNCINYADINTDGESVAGIVALVSDLRYPMELNNVINVGNITGSGTTAGIVATFKKEDDYYNSARAHVLESANYGNIESKSNGNAVAGIIAEAILDGVVIENCANHGNINSFNARYAGGIAGIIGLNSGAWHKDNVKVLSCCNRGTISSDFFNGYIGGIIARQGDGHLNTPQWGTYDCYNAGIIETDHNEDTGGVLGNADNEVLISRCINIGKVNHGNGAVGTRAGPFHPSDLYFLDDTGKDWKANRFYEGDKKNPEKFNSFNFDKVWAIDYDNSMNNGFPYLRNCRYQSMKVESDS